ncbi:hypothetical protein ACINWC743_1278 [Acinetobacter sp. WC-743]|nr:hypothetical protein ACINWC743_1278 [Acinetobacter sp. WC-743]
MNLKGVISSEKPIGEQRKGVGFYQEALDHMVRQGYGNASFEAG